MSRARRGLDAEARSCTERVPRQRALGSATLRLCAACALCFLSALDVSAQTDRQRAEALARRAAQRIRALHAEADRLAGEERTILNDLSRLEIERQLKAQEVAQLDAELAVTQAELLAASEAVSRLEEEVIAGAPAVGARLAALYKMGRPGYWRLLLDVEDVRGVGRAYRTVAAMARIDRDRIAAHRARLESLRAARDQTQRRLQQRRQLQAQASAARAALDRAIQARNARVQTIDRQRDLNAQLTGELQDAQRKLQSALADIGAGRAASPALPLKPFRGDLPWPARGPVTSGFGRQRDPRFGTAIVRNGVEIGVREGEEIHAVHDGHVAFAGPFTGFGNLVIVEHEEGTYSLYGYLDEMWVKRDDPVERQRPVGTAGRTPTGRAATYFELRVDGRPVDPLQWLKR